MYHKHQEVDERTSTYIQDRLSWNCIAKSSGKGEGTRWDVLMVPFTEKWIMEESISFLMKVINVLNVGHTFVFSTYESNSLGLRNQSLRVERKLRLIVTVSLLLSSFLILLLSSFLVPLLSWFTCHCILVTHSIRLRLRIHSTDSINTSNPSEIGTYLKGKTCELSTPWLIQHFKGRKQRRDSWGSHDEKYPKSRFRTRCWHSLWYSSFEWMATSEEWRKMKQVGW